MSKRNIKRIIKKVVDNPGIAIEKGMKKSYKTVKYVGKNKKVKKVIDNPTNVIEKGIKKSWNVTKSFGQGVKKGIHNEKSMKK